MKEKISLAGDLGSGKSTVSAILKVALDAETYSTGALVREIAKRHGMSVGELNVYMETHPEIDHEIDDGLRALSRDERRLIIDSRMAWHFTEGTFKIYLCTAPEVSAARILSACRAEERAASLNEMIESIHNRRQSEKKRYTEQYGVDITDLTNYSLVVDTTVATPDEVAEIILSSFRAWCEDTSFTRAYISPSRLRVPTDGAEGEDVTAAERDGLFYVQSGVACARELARDGSVFVPLRLVADKREATYTSI